jgi:uncharacterized damage-inducible protein DinB
LDVPGFFLLQHAAIHGGWTRALLTDLSERQLRDRPTSDVNSIAWLLWHIARGEDIGINLFVGRTSQVLNDEGWLARLNVTARDLGVGMSDEEADELSATVDLAALRGYWDAVGQRTRTVVGSLSAADLDEVIDAALVKRIVEEQDALRECARWGLKVWADRSRGDFLGYLGLSHAYEHFGGARVLRGMLGFRGR